MNRRDFIHQTSILTSGLFLQNSIALAALPEDLIKVTILHTNDMHSRIDPFPNDGRQHANMGGMARRAAMIKKIRNEEANVLLLDSGDIFQGTPYFNYYGGELEYKLMSNMGYDASTIGNHDFDNAIDGIFRMQPHASFPLLNANYDFSKNALKGLFKPYKIFEKGGMKIGVFGIGLELEGLVPDKLHQNTIYNDAVAVSKEMVQELYTQKCDFIICLSHLGYSYIDKRISDTSLARQVSGIDLILGGHTHTFLEKPMIYRNKEGYTTWIGQVGWAGINLGRVDIEFNKGKNNKILTGTSLNVTIQATNG